MVPVKLLGKDMFKNDSDVSYVILKCETPYTILHSHDYFEVTIITNGKVMHYINGVENIIEANTAVFLRPDDKHYFDSIEGARFEYINIAFTGQTAEDLFSYFGNISDIELFKSYEFPPTVQLSTDDVNEITKTIGELSLISSANAVQKEKTYLRFLLSELFFKYYKNISVENRYYPSWFDELITKLNKYEHFSLGVEHLEELSGKSLGYLSRVFKQKLNTTPTEYINNLRLKYCANKLIHSNDDILDIAIEVGFNNLSHFYHLFKKKYQLSPNKFRKENMKII